MNLASRRAARTLLLAGAALAGLGLASAAEDWRTPAEISGYRTTPRGDETLAYLRRLARSAPKQMRIDVFGRTAEGRELVAAIVSADGVFEPEALHRAGRPVLLVQNAIHAGEMDGKDACLALLRDMLATKTRAALLGRTVLVVIPIYNADGHERFGPYNRINQNGPEEMGFRTQGRNLNLNRDYLKADAPETRAFLKLWNRWLPDFFVDNHVTDGADYQYDVTFGLADGPDADPALAAWQRDVVWPTLKAEVDAAGHLAGPFIDLVDETDPAKGLQDWGAPPRFSHGYVVLQSRPGMLVEMHMLKDYRTRVTGNYEILRALLEVLNRDAALLTRLNREADATTVAAGRTASRDAWLPLRTGPSKETEPFDYRGIAFRRRLSEVSGRVTIEYTGEKEDRTIPRPKGRTTRLAIAPPRAYIVPAPWQDVIEVLEAHGVRVLRTSAPFSAEVQAYRCEGARWPERPFEGRHPMFNAGPEREALRCAPRNERFDFPAGSAVVPLDQRAAKVAIHFLEPEAPDSALQWGFFDAIFEQKEYGDERVLEKLARTMLAEDAALRAEFEGKLASDASFAADPRARLEFFYRRSPWWDARIGLYPVGRLASLEGVPLAPAVPGATRR